jgi:putative nucleotidyltransferase with HDIG domain
MNVRQILFTETEGQALQRLMPQLAGSHDDWEIVLAGDADAALELLSQRAFATVIASFGNDQENCEHFLQAVQKRAPAAVRYALLPGQSDINGADFPESAYQCFPSDCTATDLEAAIQRGLGVWRQCSNNPALAALLSNLHKIPTPPILYFEIREELNSPDSDARSIADIISHDPALSAKILKVANSGFYALPRTITAIHEAISFMGTDTVTSLVLAAHVFNRMPLPGINLDSMWQHSLMVAALARHIATEEGGDRLTVNTAGVAGLLHDIGQLTLLSNVPELYQSMLRQAAGNENALLDMEREQFGLGHPELGSYVLGLWSLPDAVVGAVARHHDWSAEDGQSASLINTAVFSAEWALQVFPADDLAHRQSEHDCPFDTSPDRIEGWRGICEQLMR